MYAKDRYHCHIIYIEESQLCKTSRCERKIIVYPPIHRYSQIWMNVPNFYNRGELTARISPHPVDFTVLNHHKNQHLIQVHTPMKHNS